MSNTVYVIFVRFAIYDSIHNLPKVIKYSIEYNVFSASMGFQSLNEHVPHGFGFGNMLRVGYTKPVSR